MRRPSVISHGGFSSVTALRAANGSANVPEIGIEAALLEVERDMFGNRDHVHGHIPHGNRFDGPRSDGVAASAMGPSRAHIRQGPPAETLSIGYRKKDKSYADEEGRHADDRHSSQKIADGVMEAIDKEIGGLVSRFRGRVREYEKRVEFARVTSEQWQEEKLALEERIEDLTYEASDLRDQMTSAMASGRGPQTMFFGKQGHSLEQRIRNMGSGIGLDVDIDGMEQDTGIQKRATMGGMLLSFRRRLRRWRQRCLPLQRDIVFVSSRYGRACGSFFRFHRFLGLLSWVMCVLYLPLLVPHAFSEHADLRKGSCGKLPFSCAWLYGGFFKGDANGQRDPWLAFRYVGVAALSSIACLCFSMVRWSEHDRNFQIERVNEELQPRRWSKLVLAAWDFRLAPGEDRHNFQHALTNQLKSLYEEDLEMKRIALRTRLQWYLLYARRVVGVLVNLGFIGAAWSCISWATVRRYDIESRVTRILGGRIGTEVGAFAPNIVVALVGMILPFATKSITSLEAWSPTMLATQYLWRLYLGKIVNILIFVAICVELVVNRPLFGQKKVLVQHDTSYACLEDEAGVRLLFLVLSELVLSLILKPIGCLLSEWCWSLMCQSPQFEKPVFDMADYAVDIVYFQCLIWVTAILAPTIVLIAPLLFYSLFKWMRFTLLHLSSRPFVAETSALCTAQMQLQCFTSCLFIALTAGLATKGLPHATGCGPFDSSAPPGSMFKNLDIPGQAAVMSVVAWLADNPQVIFGIMPVLFILSLLGRNRVHALRVALGQLQQASHRHVQALEGELWRMERQNELLNRRVQWHEKPVGTGS